MSGPPWEPDKILLLSEEAVNEPARPEISAITSQRAQQTTPQIPPTVESDSPQSGSKDEDEAWPAEGTNEGIQAANEAKFPQYPKTILSADPVLLQTQNPANSAEQIKTPISAAQCQIYGSTLPGPQSQDDDEDSSPHVQDLDLANHALCSNHDMTTSGHGNNALTHFWFRMATLVGQRQLTGNTESCQKTSYQLYHI